MYGVPDMPGWYSLSTKAFVFLLPAVLYTRAWDDGRYSQVINAVLSLRL